MKTLTELEEQRDALNTRINELSASEGWSDRVDGLQTQYDLLIRDINDYENNPEGAGETLALRAYCVEGTRNMLGN